MPVHEERFEEVLNEILSSFFRASNESSKQVIPKIFFSLISRHLGPKNIQVIFLFFGVISAGNQNERIKNIVMNGESL